MTKLDFATHVPIDSGLTIALVNETYESEIEIFNPGLYFTKVILYKYFFVCHFGLTIELCCLLYTSICLLLVDHTYTKKFELISDEDLYLQDRLECDVQLCR